MPVVELDENEWQQVLGIVGDAPWRIANPLLMKIGNQLRVQALALQSGAQPAPRVTQPKDVKIDAEPLSKRN